MLKEIQEGAYAEEVDRRERRRAPLVQRRSARPSAASSSRRWGRKLRVMMPFLDPVTVTKRRRREAGGRPSRVGRRQMTDRITIFDTTLRDGEQSPGCSMIAAEKVRLARQLERLGVDIIEAGFPIASPGEVDSVQVVAEEVRSVRVAALARAKEADIKAAGKALARRGPPGHPHLPRHLRHPPQVQAQDLARRGAEAGGGRRSRLARTFAPEVEFSAEDASRTDYAYLREVLQAVHEAGAADPERARHRRATPCPTSTRRWSSKLVRDIPGADHLRALPQRPRPRGGQLHRRRARREPARSSARSTASASARATPRLEEIVMALRVRGETLGAATGVRARAAGPHERHALERHRRLAAAQQGGGRPQRLRPRGGHPPARHPREPALLRDHDPGQRGRARDRARAGQALGQARGGVAPAGPGARPQPEELDEITAAGEGARRQEEVRLRRRPADSWPSALRSGGPASCATRSCPATPSCPPPRSRCEVDGQVRTASAVGNGPLDAALKAADAALGLNLELLEMHTRAVTAGRDAPRRGAGARPPRGRRVPGPGREHRHPRGDAEGVSVGGGHRARRAAWRRRPELMTARARCSRRSGTRTWCAPRPPTRRRCSTSTCTSCTRSRRPRPSRCCASAASRSAGPTSRWPPWTTPPRRRPG